MFSSTKCVTGLAAAMCADRGLFSLRTPVYEFLPGYRNQCWWDGRTLREIGPGGRPVYLFDLLNMTMSQLVSNHDEQVAQIKSGINNAYKTIISEHLPRILQDIDISGIIEQRINEMDMDEAEAIILDVMKKELRAIVWLGALLGSIMGTVNALIL